eukprot:g163.t1
MTPPPVNMFIVKIHSLECFSSCFEWEVTNIFYFLWFSCTIALLQWHALRKTRIDSVLTALCVIVIAAALSLIHSHVLDIEDPIDGRLLMLWNFVSFAVCWALSNVIHDAETDLNAPLLYTKAVPRLVMPINVCVERDNRPSKDRPYYETIQKLKQASAPRTRTEQSTRIAPIFSRLRLMWFAIIIGAMLVLKHGLKIHMDYVVMICWFAFAVMTTVIERYLGIKRWFMNTYRRFKPSHDARSPWRVVDEKLSENFSPLVVFVNPLSGGNLGSLLLEHVEELNLNELQVWSMAWGDPIYAIRPFDDCLRAGRKLRVLVCGGDGTVAWVLGPTGIGGLPEDLRKSVTVAILPLGTGNDLARALGWGSGYSGDQHSLKQAIGELCRAHEVLLDRWKVEVVAPAATRRASFTFSRRSRKQGRGGKKKRAAAPTPVAATTTQTKVHLMNNYMGFGCGAQVSLNFHRRRERCKWLFQNQIFNKFIYGMIGGAQVIKHVLDRFIASDDETFSNSIKIRCDGRLVDLTGYEGIIIMNIPFYGGGMNMWDRAMDIEPDSPALHARKPPEDAKIFESLSTKRYTGSGGDEDDGGENDEDARFHRRLRRRRRSSNATKSCQSFNDKMLEVVGVRMANLAVGQIGLPTGERLDQCRRIDIELTRSLAMQIDGEPEMVKAGGKLMIRHHQQAWMLQRSQILTSESASVLRSVLQWGKAQRILDQTQSEALNAELGRRAFDAGKSS